MNCRAGKAVHFDDGGPCSSGGGAPPPGPDCGPPTVSVKLGILSQGGIYTTPIPLELTQGSAQPDICGLQVSNVSTEWRQPPGQPPSLLLRVWADRPGPFNTEFSVRLPGQHQEVVRVHVVATVMPRNKGTPGLKETVHCVGFTADTDTDAASDWQGF